MLRFFLKKNKKGEFQEETLEKVKNFYHWLPL